MAFNYGDFDINSLIQGMKGGDLGKLGTLSSDAITRSFLPRYSRAVDNVYSRGFTRRGSQYNRAMAPIDQAFSTSLISGIPQLWLQGQQNRRADADLDIRRKQLEIMRDREDRAYENNEYAISQRGQGSLLDKMFDLGRAYLGGRK